MISSSAPANRHQSREFLDEAFGYAGMDWQKYVEIDPRYFRPTEVDYLLADPTKARQATRAGSRRSNSTNWCASWWMPTWN